MLEVLGLDGVTVSVYRTMVIHQGWGVMRIADHLQISPAEVHASLDRLAELTLVRQSLDRPDQFRPVDPEFGLQCLVHTQQAELLRRQQELNESQAIVSGFIAELRSASSRVEIEQLVGVDEVQTRLERLAESATTECLSYVPGGAQLAESIAAGAPLNEAALARGVSIMTIYLDSVRNDPTTLSYAQRLTELGGKIRTVPTLPERLLIVDREVALVPLDPDNGRQGAVQLVGRGLVTMLVAFFEHMWDTATPLFSRVPDRNEHGLTAQERELLRLLATGLTDECAAKRLGLSVRTVRRMMADLMDRLGAHSRFEAGLRVAEQSWLMS
jgi:DNA-binding CsgD family transcriptional regulator/sugar-specific transcriptional regulator TrmB